MKKKCITRCASIQARTIRQCDLSLQCDEGTRPAYYTTRNRGILSLMPVCSGHCILDMHKCHHWCSLPLTTTNITITITITMGSVFNYSRQYVQRVCSFTLWNMFNCRLEYVQLLVRVCSNTLGGGWPDCLGCLAWLVGLAGLAGWLGCLAQLAWIA